MILQVDRFHGDFLGWWKASNKNQKTQFSPAKAVNDVIFGGAAKKKILDEFEVIFFGGGSFSSLAFATSKFGASVCLPKNDT